MDIECKVGTIRQIHQRLKQEGFYIGEATLRQWVRDGTLPSTPVGNRTLIAYKNVKKILCGAAVTK